MTIFSAQGLLEKYLSNVTLKKIEQKYNQYAHLILIFHIYSFQLKCSLLIYMDKKHL